MSKKKKIKINQKEIELSNLDKIFYPQKKIKKKDIIDYYEKIADYMLPHLKNRPLVMQRFPDGINKEGFYEKELPSYFPTWINSKKVDLQEEGSQKLVIIEKKADLIYLVNQGTLVFHVWLSNEKNISQPDKIVFDLDPPENSNFGILRFAANQLKRIFEEKDLNVFIMTTGSKGLHVVIPFYPEYSFYEIREFVKKMATKLASQFPERLTIEMRKEKRKGRVFLDYLRNSYGQTTVVPYSLRAINHAPTATPLDWSELSSVNDPQKYHISNIFQRLGHKKDPWESIYQKAKKLRL